MNHRLLSALSPLALGLSLLGCVGVPKAPDPRVRHAEPRVKPGRAVVFEPKCRGPSAPCTPAFKSAIVGRLSSELELAGYQMIEGEDLLAEARRREQARGGLEANSPVGDLDVRAAGETMTSLTYADLPPARKRALLEEARADGVLVLNIVVSADQESAFWYDVHVIELNARYTTGPDNELGWVARCGVAAENTEALGGPDITYQEAADVLARCVADQILR